jgi:hypothetical protein
MLKGRTDFAFTLLRDIYGLGDNDIADLNPADLVERVQRIHKGLSAEHEFAAIASWLGKCSLVSQLDNLLHSSGHYRAPDFLVVTEYNGRNVPFLVEVKSEDKDKIVWSAKYFESLRGFAKLMKLPLLTAWKRGRLWVLVDSDLFTKSISAFHLTFDRALKNSLMSPLFGNVWIQFTREFRLELTMRLRGDIDNIDFAAEVLPEGNYHFTIEAAGIWGKEGKLSPSDGRNLWWFLIMAISKDNFERVLDVATHSFVAESDSVFNLSDVLLAQLYWQGRRDNAIDWLATIRKGLPKPSMDLHALLRLALDVGAVRYVFEQSPQLIPGFLR